MTVAGVRVENFQINNMTITGVRVENFQPLPRDMKVVTEGYEEGYDDVVKVEIIRVQPSEDAKWYNGTYSVSKDSNAISAVFINGNNKGKKID